MKAPVLYDIVCSTAGHDRGRLYMVVKTETDRLYLCDGDLRRLQAPKCKNPKHVSVVSGAETLPETDKQLRQTLAAVQRAAESKEEKLLGKR